MNCCREGRMRRGKGQLIFEQGISIQRYRAQMLKPLKCQCEAFYGFPFTGPVGLSQTQPICTNAKSWLHKCKLCRVNYEIEI